MKIILLTLATIFLMSGCAKIEERLTVRESLITGKKIASVSEPFDYETMKDYIPDNEARYSARGWYAFNMITIKREFQLMAEETLKTGNTHFMIIDSDLNQEKGLLPVNTFNTMQEYCLNFNYSKGKVGTEKKCQALLSHIIKDRFIEMEFKMLKNPDYTMMAFDAKEVLSEIAKFDINKEADLLKLPVRNQN